MCRSYVEYSKQPNPILSPNVSGVCKIILVEVYFLGINAAIFSIYANANIAGGKF